MTQPTFLCAWHSKINLYSGYNKSLKLWAHILCNKKVTFKLLACYICLDYPVGFGKSLQSSVMGTGEKKY